MGRGIYFLKLLRPGQWYKNLLIFIPLIFAGRLLERDLWPILIIGFIVLCLISSISYIINDIIDLEADKRHPKKRKRVLPSGKVKKREAAVIALLIALLVIALSYFTTFWFWILAAGLFISTQIYTLYLKNIPLVDIHVIALNFIIRTVSGAVLIKDTQVSPWLLIIIFLLALFWAVGKRKAEMGVLKSEARRHKKVYRFYTEELLISLTNILAAMLLIAYILFTTSTHEMRLMITIPIATFMVFRYLFFIYTNREEAQRSERIFLDPQMLGALMLWASVSVYVLYGNFV